MKPNLKTLKISSHAVKRSIERFNRKDATDAFNYCKCLLGSAKYMGLSVCEFGNKSHLYQAGRVAIHLDINLSEIVTLYQIDKKTYIPEEIPFPLKNKLVKLYEVEINKYKRQENRMNKQLEEMKLNLNLEIAQLQLKIHRTKSAAVKNSCLARIKAISEYLMENELEIKSVQDTMRRVTRARISLGQ